MTIYWDVVVAVVLVALLAVSAAVAYRLVAVRRGATPAVLRSGGSRDWHYGGLRYTADEARFYRLVSVRFRPDLRIARASIALGTRRAPAGRELQFAEDGEQIVPLTGRSPRGAPVDVEICLDPRALTALLAWVEACSTEAVRSRPPRGGQERGRR